MPTRRAGPDGRSDSPMVAVTKQTGEKEKKLTLLGHLQEIRRRLVYCVIALIITVAISFFFTDHIIDFLESYVPKTSTIIVTEVTEMFGVWFKVCPLRCARDGTAFLHTPTDLVHPAGLDPQREEPISTC